MTGRRKWEADQARQHRLRSRRARLHPARAEQTLGHRHRRAPTLGFQRSSQQRGSRWHRVVEPSARLGCPQSSDFRGRSLSSVATAWRSSSVLLDRSSPCGKYWRRRPLVFSFVPRCQGLRGRRSRPEVGGDAEGAVLWPSRLLGPRSGLAHGGGHVADDGDEAVADGFALRSRPRWPSIRKRLERSTSVATGGARWRRRSQDRPQCPGTLRSVASSGRWLIGVIGSTNRGRRASGCRWGRRAIRRGAAGSRARGAVRPWRGRRWLGRWSRDTRISGCGQEVLDQPVADLLRRPLFFSLTCTYSRSVRSATSLACRGRATCDRHPVSGVAGHVAP